MTDTTCATAAAVLRRPGTSPSQSATARIPSAHGLAQVRVRTLGARPVGPLQVIGTGPAATRPDFLHH
ncbi:hypothetical protein [Curtobacterium sp. TXMA1]|uniref:hypothetical protein n=1 Tax=Curtobacterium sp. TXMA1 TaxID=2876939 RepID=UPI001CCFBE10|nr:hypothetical protein [Curtobacterium sp. TXMA1]UBQ01706.1 hypothetical protein LCG91_11565 [Curtobacterium sp. TXMA1]